MSGRAPRHPAVQFSGTGRERISSPDRCELILTPASESVSFQVLSRAHSSTGSLTFIRQYGPRGRGLGTRGLFLVRLSIRIPVTV